jgi:hypothetical protein
MLYTMTVPVEDHCSPIQRVRGVQRGLYMVLAAVFFGLAALGTVLPVLPTTPFLLLTSYFLVRSSPRLNRRLSASRLFGPVLRDWHEHRAIRPRVKLVALVLLVTVVVLTAALGSLPTPLLVFLLVAAATGFTVVWRLPVIRS